MNDWLVWPHIHGTPVYGDFSNGRSFLYLWAEKDYLRAYERIPNAGNVQFTKTPSTSNVRAPKVLMPGGMLSLAIDPQSTGVLFATIPDESGQVGIIRRGVLRAFDPIPDARGKLKEIWNDENSPPYGLAKFVPPTLANGRVYLATATAGVLVYGVKAR